MEASECCSSPDGGSAASKNGSRGKRFIGYISMDGPSGKRLCEGCKEAVRAQSLKLYCEVWKSLPELVGVEVPGWGGE